MTVSATYRWRRVFDATLGWIERELGRFLFGADPDPARRLARFKPMAELALACDLGLGARLDASSPWARLQAGRLRTLRDAIAGDVGEGRVLAELAQQAPASASVLSALATFVEILDRWGASAGWQEERTWSAGASPGWVASFDLLSVGPGPLSGDLVTMICYVVLFRSSFGRTPVLVRSHERAWVRARAPLWQQQHLGDIDLSCLLALMMRCLEVEEDPVDVPGAIFGRQEADGAVVGPHEIDIPPEAGADASFPWFRRRFHSTLLANMAAAMSQRSMGI